MAQLTPVEVPNHSGSNPDGGWYAEDQEHRRILGPFLTRKDCESAIAAANTEHQGKVGLAAGAIGAGGTP